MSGSIAKISTIPDVVEDKHVIIEGKPNAVQLKSKSFPPIKVGKSTPRIERGSSFPSVKDRVKEFEEKISKSP